MPPAQHISPQQHFDEKLLPAPAPAHQSPGAGPVVGAIIIIILMIFGGFYFWGAYLNHQRPTISAPTTPSTTNTEPSAT